MAAEATDKTGCVALYAARIHYYANEILKTQQVEGVQGFDDQPWEMPYQRLAAKIYRKNLPTSYLTTLANVFAGCAQTMDAQPAPPEEVAEDWRIVHAYLNNGSQAIAENLDTAIEPAWEDPTDKDPTTPNNVRFDILATYTTTHGISLLCDAGQSVFGHLSGRGRITDEQLEILAGLADGRTYDQLAERHNCSVRTVHRNVGRICEALQVNDKQQAITLAAHNKWI